MKEVETMQSAGDDKKYLNALFSILRKTESISLAVQKTRFNTTELRLIGEILNAKYIGKRLISTQLAKLLEVTRSAISQIVSRLEKQGVLKRVADDVDRKIAYIELTDEALASYDADLKVYVNSTDKLVQKFGTERFECMCALFEEFHEMAETEKAAAGLTQLQAVEEEKVE